MVKKRGRKPGQSTKSKSQSVAKDIDKTENSAAVTINIEDAETDQVKDNELEVIRDVLQEILERVKPDVARDAAMGAVKDGIIRLMEAITWKIEGLKDIEEPKDSSGELVGRNEENEVEHRNAITLQYFQETLENVQKSLNSEQANENEQTENVFTELHKQQPVFTMHPPDECPIYSKIADQLKRPQYQVIDKDIAGFCEACNSSRNTWPIFMRNNVYANALMGATGKAPLNRLVFPGEELPPNIAGTFYLPFQENAFPYSIYDSSDVTDSPLDIMDHGYEDLIEVNTDLSLEQLLVLFEFSIRRIYDKLNLSKDVYYSFVGKVLSPITTGEAIPYGTEGIAKENVDERKKIENLTKAKETLSGNEQKSESHEQTCNVPTEQKASNTTLKKRKLQKSKKTLPPMRVKVPATSCIQLRARAGCEPFCIVSFGHIKINIYDRNELENVECYYEDYMNKIFPKPAPMRNGKQCHVII